MWLIRDIYSIYDGFGTLQDSEGIECNLSKVKINLLFNNI